MNIKHRDQTIVISGITSAIGISLAKFIAEKGMRVVGFSRHVDKVKHVLSHPLIELKSADLNDQILMHSICKDAEIVVHLAALSAPWGTYEDFYKVNVKGTEALIQAASHSRLKRFIHISTPSIYFDFKDRLDISEKAHLPPRSVNAYSETKKIAEKIVDSANIPTITLRPRAIFGPHDQTLFPRVLKACQNRGIPCFRKNSPMIDITYVDNLTYAIWLAIEAPDSCLGQKYNITNGEPRALVDILEPLLNKLSIKASKKYIPYPLAYAIASFSELKSKITQKEPVFTRYGLGVLTFSQTLSIEKAKQELNYHPIISLDEGIDKYVKWLQTQ